MRVPLAIAEAALAAACEARAVSDGAAVTAGVEAALAADRRCWGRGLLARLSDLPVSATSQREVLAALAEEFFAAADEIDHGIGEASQARLPAYAVELTAGPRERSAREVLNTTR